MTVDKNELINLYIGGLSLRQVANKLGISMQRVSQILIKEGVPRRPKHITRHAYNYNQTPPTAESEK